MDEVTTMPSDDVPAIQHIVQRKLGRCLLRLQQYERQLKAIVAHVELSGAADRLSIIREQKIAYAQNKTMGTLMGILTESFLTPPLPNEEESQIQANVGDQIGLRYGCRLEMTAEHYEAMKADLKELVDLRNKLVHHFIERFDLWSESGCQAADGFLEESYETINRHCLNLQCWVKTLFEARAKIASFIQSQSLEDVFDGIRVDGSVDWPGSGICRCLREAETKLAEGGWTRLEAAIRWIGGTYPEQMPKRYGCSSWRHALHESRQFEIRKSQADNKPTAVWYRSKIS
ncbi:OST-HTH/LOTUS domain-containing protein [Pseudomonas wadenswilerensis]|uniref:OST-HTH/LOTUS domain-containing protein n=1 Tax=Pseudomonas wadenswilerensis TaxID=1785161 RepID=UPI00215ED7F2|nr:OST-HTH/LOTUS domain-containing protein [Pseudomonas wadenswilerensis]UVM20057.1 OST-HTH/LOTUS domain-containing protein [Pseudomonas wadenswilerensis]